MVIPIAPSEDKLWRLFESIPKEIVIGELILVGPVLPSLSEGIVQNLPFAKVRLIESGMRRAKQLHQGVMNASKKYVWLVHADSKLSVELFLEIERHIRQCRKELLYFMLEFIDCENMNMSPQELGVQFRSRCLGMPFGDQSFLFAREDYHEKIFFDPSLAYGEDHVFIWKWRLAGNRLLGSPYCIQTSAREYQEGKWRLTLRYLYLSLKQALPYFLKS